MVIRAPDVDRAVEAAVVLVDVVGDVGHEVGQRAVALPEHAILVVTELRGAQPERALGFVGQAALAQQLDGASSTRPAS